MASPLRDGRYVLVRPLGEGAQGETFEARDEKDGRQVAIKRFSVRGASSWKDVELAEREARVLASLHHPKLPAYLDRFEEDGALYLVMELIEGESLASMRKRGASLGEADVVRLLRDASEVLDYLHGRAPPVIHRDLKPGNVIRRPDGSFAFVDFGAVRDKLRPDGGSTVVGTFGYMAPEQFQGRAQPASDVYAIGATALAMLTGEEPERLPHEGLAIDVERALRGAARPALARVLARMLEPDPDVRPSRIAPLLDEPRRHDAPPRRHRKQREPWEAWEPWRESEAWREAWSRVAERNAHEAERARHRAERRAERARARADRWKERHGPFVPWPLAAVLTLGLTVAIVSVTLALQFVVPTVLQFLSLFFGRGLREAARQTSDAGRRAGNALGRARRVAARGFDPPASSKTEPASKLRVGAQEDRRVRVDDDRDAQAFDEAAAEEEWEREARAPSRRR